jgi:large subunit ribosomal protein L35e
MSACELIIYFSQVKAFELRNKNKTELIKVLDEQKQKLAEIRVQKVAGGRSQEV